MRRSVGLRRAVAASVAVHVVAAAVLVAVLRPHPTPRRTSPGLDSRVRDVILRIDPGEAIPVPITPPEAEPPRPEPVEPPPEVVEPPARLPAASRTPHVTPVSVALPAEVLAAIRRPRPAGATTTDPGVRPAGAAAEPAKPVHGVLGPGKAVVYVLDCSGSMGEFGQLGAAREALLATLRRQPESVRFQILVYNNTTRPLLPGGLIPATPENLAAATAALARTTAAGGSRHAEAVRAAVQLRPDVVLVLTDDDLSPVPQPPGRRPVPVWVARVTPAGVEAPKEVH